MYTEDPQNDLSTRKYYFLSSFTTPKTNDMYYEFCFEENDINASKLVSGSFSSRAKKFVSEYYRLGAGKTSIVFMNGNNGYVVPNLIYETDSYYYIMVVVPVIASIILFGVLLKLVYM